MENPLVKNWVMVASRGGLAILFGLAILLWRTVTLNELVTLFGAYAFLDGVYTLLSVLRRSSGHPLEWWPVAAEGVAGVVLGALAIVWPWVSYRFIDTVAVWGIVTGILEIILAFRIPRDLASHWFLAWGGIASLFLAVMIYVLPHAVVQDVVWSLGVYALVFGVLVSLVALRLRRKSRAVAGY